MADRDLALTLVHALNQLENPLPIKQHEAFLMLCRDAEDETVDGVMDRYETMKVLARTHVLRYLAHIATPRAQWHLAHTLMKATGLERQAAQLALEHIPSEEKVDTMLVLLVHPAEELQRLAVAALGKSRNAKAFVPLLHQFSSASPALRVEILKAFERIEDIRAAAVARGALTDAEPSVICQGIQLLRHFRRWRDARVVALLVVHRDPTVRRKACWGLGGLRTGKARRALMTALTKDANDAVRIEAAKSLGAYPSRDVVRALVLAATGDASVMVRKVAGFSLAGFIRPRAVREFVRLLKEPNDRVHVVAIEQLGYRKDPRAVPVLARWADASTALSRRVAAVEALGNFKDPKVVPVLERALTGPQPLPYAAAYSLCSFAGARDLTILSRLLRPSQGLGPDVLQVFGYHLSVVVYVRELPEEILAVIRAWLASSVMQLRYLALRILLVAGRVEDLAALRMLRGQEPDPDVREIAGEVIQEIMLRYGEVLRARVAVGDAPEGAACWRWLRRVPVPAPDQVSWMRAVVEALTRPGAGGRPAAVLGRWVRKWPDRLAAILEEGGGTHPLAPLFYRCLDRAGSVRPLTARECGAVLNGLSHPDPSVRRAAAGATRWIDSLDAVRRVSALSFSGDDPELREAARRSIRHWLVAPA